MPALDTVQEELIKWVATREDEVVFQPQDGFYPFDMLLDAYQAGHEKGEESFKTKIREKFFENMKKVTTGLNEMLKYLADKQITPRKLFINHSFSGSDILITIPTEIYLTKNFINQAYNSALKIQKSFKDINLSISFMEDVESIDIDLLKTDGFGFSYDLAANKPMY